MNAGEQNMSKPVRRKQMLNWNKKHPKLPSLTSKIIATINGNPERMQVEIMPACHEYQNQ